jgi:hypothetical protein
MGFGLTKYWDLYFTHYGNEELLNNRTCLPKAGPHPSRPLCVSKKGHPKVKTIWMPLGG